MPWPAELPPLFKGSGYAEEWPDASYRSEADSGPGKSRPRPDAPNEMLPRTQILTGTQLERLKRFWRDELTKGALSFEEFHPRILDTVTLKFKGSIRINYQDGFYMTSFTLEVLP